MNICNNWWNIVNWEDVSRRSDRAPVIPARGIYIDSGSKPGMTMTMLIINNLHVTVDNKEVVKGVSLEINPGEIHALMGPNGSGKSSLAMAIAGHPEIQWGKEEGVTITLDGKILRIRRRTRGQEWDCFLASQYPVGVGGITVEQLLRRAVQEKLTNEQTDKLTKKLQMMKKANLSML